MDLYFTAVPGIIILGLCYYLYKTYFATGKGSYAHPFLLSVNFHFTRKCNYACGFCFHTAKTSYVTPLEDAKRGLHKLANMGMRKLNFSGGEPFLYAKHLGELCKFAKEVLRLESVSIVSNGSKIRRSFFEKYAEYVDILAVSVDSFKEETNVKIGRGTGSHLEKLGDIADLCAEFNVKFKLNTVVNQYNHAEEFAKYIQRLNPCRWKCFQVLPVETENTGDGARRKVDEFLITDEEFETFCARHQKLACFVPESNRNMKSSYVILDEYMRFLNKGDKYDESKSILDVSVEEAMKNIDFEQNVFLERGGVYDWSKEEGGGCKMDPKLEF